MFLVDQVDGFISIHLKLVISTYNLLHLGNVKCIEVHLPGTHPANQLTC